VVALTHSRLAPGEKTFPFMLNGGWTDSRASLDAEAKEKSPAPGGNRTPVILTLAINFANLLRHSKEM
jgi:hypothetical protein